MNGMWFEIQEREKCAHKRRYDDNWWNSQAIQWVWVRLRDTMISGVYKYVCMCMCVFLFGANVYYTICICRGIARREWLLSILRQTMILCSRFDIVSWLVRRVPWIKLSFDCVSVCLFCRLFVCLFICLIFIWRCQRK